MSYQWLDAKYINLVSFRLRNFKRKGSSQWNFSCPLCGDSRTNKHKARGYVYASKGTLLFHCHNCSATHNIPNFIKIVDQNLFNEYIKEKLVNSEIKSESAEFAIKMKPPKFHSETPLSKLRKISQLKADHPAKMYVERRLIPTDLHYKLYYCSKFKTWVNSIIPDKFESVEKDEPRLIIPFIDENGKLFGFQGRSFRKDSQLRYITIMLEERPKLFGLDTVKTDSDIYVVEGPLDSLFIANCIASAGGNIITDLPSVSEDKSKFIIVYDNEPRNEETIVKMEKAISAGYKICIWPENFKEKDINDAILSGLTPSQIKVMISDNSYYGLMASMKLITWKRV